MQKRSIPYRTLASLLVLSAFIVAGCAGKRVASSSGDASSKTKEEAGVAPVETIKPESIVTIPEDRRSTTETARAPLGAPSVPGAGREGAVQPAVPAPGAFPPGAGREGAPLGAPSALAAGESVALGDIFFDFDRYMIRRDAQPVLEANAAWIKSTPGKAILIEGHCDERGTQAYNLVLGEKRARSTKQYLEDLGVPASQVKITSFGEIRPFCTEHEERCWQKNRRAHFVVR